MVPTSPPGKAEGTGPQATKGVRRACTGKEDMTGARCLPKLSAQDTSEQLGCTTRSPLLGWEASYSFREYGTMFTLFLLGTAPTRCLLGGPVHSTGGVGCHNQPHLVAASLKKAVDAAAGLCCPHALLGHASWLTQVTFLDWDLWTSFLGSVLRFSLLCM